MTLIIILAVAAIALFYFVGVYNKLVRKRSMVEEGWSGIDVQLKKRYNLIPNLVETVPGFHVQPQQVFQQGQKLVGVGRAPQRLVFGQPDLRQA